MNSRRKLFHMINKFSYFGLRAGSSGLTAIELMITLAVFAIMASLAAPPMQNLITNYRERTAINQLTGYVRLARSEAITRSAYVSLCGSSDGKRCDGDLKEGWLVFQDANGDGLYQSASDTLIRSGSLGMGERYFTDVNGTATASPLIYSRDGSRRGGEIQWLFCFSADAKHQRQLSVNAAGYLKVEKVAVLGCN